MSVSVFLAFKLLSPIVSFIVLGLRYGFEKGIVVSVSIYWWFAIWLIAGSLSFILSWYLLGGRVWRRLS